MHQPRESGVVAYFVATNSGAAEAWPDVPSHALCKLDPSRRKGRQTTEEQACETPIAAQRRGNGAHAPCCAAVLGKSTCAQASPWRDIGHGENVEDEESDVSVSIFKKGVLGLDVRYDTHKHHLSFGGLELGLGRDLFPFFFLYYFIIDLPFV
jgi:hypothetical protein